MRIVVAARVSERHPDLSEEDVVHAVRNPIASQPRPGAVPLRYVGVGPDVAGRWVEWIKISMDDEADGWFVYHAQRPPTKKILNELGLK